ncbi:alpha/beta hydrolase [Pseudonocardia sp. CA-142604]|uniref:alpha/beta hydrolase n=1 Tax=Pseudonocardia sp. CA-142604 TaxID=3240024 RepID=UPI003D8B5A9C
MNRRPGERTHKLSAVAIRLALVFCAIGLAGVAFPGVVLALTPAVAAEPDCRRAEFTATHVPLVVSTPARVSGELCAAPRDRVVHLLVPGATYNSSYWDFPYQPERYSYVRAMRAAGIATFRLDRLGTGESNRPASVEMSLLSHAEVVRQLVPALRTGLIGGQSFEKVVIVGHSFGTLVTYAAVGSEPNLVDGVIATGVSRGPDLPGLLEILVTFTHPARLEGGRFAGMDPGYLTTVPGQRGDFYHRPAIDPQVVVVDEATKDVQSATDLGTIALPLLSTLNFRKPVLNVMGDDDLVFCQLIPCSSPLSPWNAERLLFPQVPSYDSQIVPSTGHNINLHPNAHLFFEKAIEWTRTHFPEQLTG